MNRASDIIVRSLAVLVIGLAAVVIQAPGHAGGPAWLPKPARGQGDKCVADTEWMRRNHPSVLMHQRDATVHDGIRTNRFSLKGCIDCHAVKGANGKPVTIASPQHFCRTCHDYASVRIDCFECHASRPETGAAAIKGETPHERENADVAALADYAKSLGP